MFKKIFLCLIAVAQLVCANISVGYTVSVGGQELPGTFSGHQLSRGRTVSCAALEEIARGKAEPAEYSIRTRYSLRRPDGDVRQLTDALITSSPAVGRYCAVYADGKLTGTVSDPAMLENSLLYSLHNYYYCLSSGKLELRPVYSYSGRSSDISTVCGAISVQTDKLT